MASKFIGAARGIFIQSTRYSPNTNIKDMTDAAAYGVKKRYWYLSLEGPIKETANKGEYNRFTIFPFFYFAILKIGYLCYCVSTFHHV